MGVLKEYSARGPKAVVREIDGIPVCVGGERIARYRRGKKPKPPMAELGIEKLKPQQKLVLRNKFELGMSNRQAAIQAGYEETSASRVIPRLLQRKPIQDALTAKGITDFKIAEVIAEGFEQSVTRGIVSAKRKWNGITLIQSSSASGADRPLPTGFCSIISSGSSRSTRAL